MAPLQTSHQHKTGAPSTRPRTSSEPALARMWAVAGAALSMSWVRMRVASSDWWASRMVVSVISTPAEGSSWKRVHA